VRAVAGQRERAVQEMGQEVARCKKELADAEQQALEAREELGRRPSPRSVARKVGVRGG
jgi:hypothetical protein